MLKRLSLVVIFVITQTTWAGSCPEDVQVISKGQVANCDGILLSPEASKKADEAADDAKYYKNLSDKLQVRKSYADEEINILDTRLKNYVEESQTLAAELTRKEDSGKWEKVIYFTLGILATGIAIDGASKLKK